MVERAELTAYMRWLKETRGLEFDTYDDLWRWSVEHLEDFWATVWERYGVVADGSHDTVLADDSMPGAKWFPGTRLNYAERMFAGKPDDRVAILHASETRELAELTWGELREQVERIRAGLSGLGVGKGDRVVAYMPNLPETVAAFLATASLGAIWSSAAPEFGARSVVDRFAQIEPKVLLAVDGYRYGGKDFDRMELVAELEQEMPSLEHTVVLPYVSAEPDLSGLKKGRLWPDLVAERAPLAFERVEFDHPLWVLYSSGTTGLPKAIVQGQGGILLEQLKKGYLHLDLHEGDRIFWFTTTGWMMWNFLVGGLLTDAAIVLYDGSPALDDMRVLWDLAERAKATTFGTSAGFIAACMKAGVEPSSFDLSALTAVGSTGSPLSPEGFEWVYEHVGSDTWLFSTSGGTDVCTAFVGGVAILPVYRGELQARSLGCAVEAWDEDGNALIDEVGELVVTRPMPSMPVFFWNDPDGSRYREAYFEMYPGVWRHGDWIRITPRGTSIIYGRSDSTINRGGVRMGTSEIYRVVLGLDDVVDALVVDVPNEDGGDAWMPLFVVLREGVELDEDLTKAIKREIREHCSPRHVPNDVIPVTEVPRTLSGKVLEVPVKKILMGMAPERAASRDSLANPAALDWFVDFAKARA
ncbi:MAG: acetoacetyl-CoA synthetase [Thermoleophilaceae bacterium]|nr:acetoacetyl-CoA synthetase [Thermoleophilaceae bacterium]